MRRSHDSACFWLVVRGGSPADLSGHLRFCLDAAARYRSIFNREIGRRTDVVGIFPDDASLIRLVSMLAIEANDEWLVGPCYMSRQSMDLLWTERGQSTPAPKKINKEVGELVAA